MARNPIIGSCPCPVAGCSEPGEVRRFSSKHTRDSGRRFAGKLYVDCPTHGRFGTDVKPGFQVWISEHATMREGAELDVAPPALAPKPIEKSPAKPNTAPAPDPSAAAMRRGGFGFFKS